ncbi:MAG: tRNA (adenosine(37)-N6)-threonylcarbamoyltransferase complex dimerization subunit type 1 TsaB [Micrococcales bacterium]|nr:tRNA (adenosine(37)-N6)-threonylcarbamoyltransferase complex dimerization subunit type 1 TsaB [Micrococcales bacterium]
MSELPGAVLGISTADDVTVGLVRPGQPDATLHGGGPRAHLESLAPLVAGLLAQAGLEGSDLVGIGVGRGPAAYTGLRIGLATARALGLAWGIPVWGISDLDVLAVQSQANLQLGAGQTILATLDAKRKEVYWSLYRASDHGVELLQGPAVSKPGDAASAKTVAGPGAMLYPDQLALSPGAPTTIDAAVLARQAARLAAAGAATSLEPLYLRRPHVQGPAPSKSVLP